MNPGESTRSVPSRAMAMSRRRLKDIARREGIRPDAFSLDGGFGEGKYVLSIVPGGWEVYFVERGDRTRPRSFDTEADATDYLLDLLINDPTTRG